MIASQMTPLQIANFDTPRLVQEFIARAARLRGPIDFKTPIRKLTPAGEHVVQEIKSIAQELMRRNAHDEACDLMDHENRNVAAWAASELGLLDKTFYFAAMDGVNKGARAREVLAFRERVRRGPPRGPSLKRMSVEQLLARFEDAGIRRSLTRFMDTDEDPYAVEEKNKTKKEAMAVAAELHARGCENELERFFAHGNDSVRCAAATARLDDNPAGAIPILRHIESGSGWESIEAYIHLTLPAALSRSRKQE